MPFPPGQFIPAIDCGRNTSTIFTRALTLVAHGLPCFPCGIAKKPTTPRGYKDAICDRGRTAGIVEAIPWPARWCSDR